MYRMAIIGVGMISIKAMIPGIRQARMADLTALGTSSREKAQSLSAKYGVDRCYPSYEEVLEDPDVDGVYIGLPNHLHKEWTLKALAHGKHVLCDKPLGMDLAEAREMEAAARAAGRVLMEGFMYRFHPQHALVKKLIRNGAIGRVFLFEAHFHYFMEDPDNIRLKRETGGGGLYDVGCYGINSARYILGAEPGSVSGAWRLGADTGVDEFCHFTLRFDGGPVATVTCGTHLPREQGYSVYGDRGIIKAPQGYVPAPHKRVHVTVIDHNGKHELHRIRGVNQYADEVDAFVAACGGATDDRIETGVENMAVLDAVRKACRSGAVESCRASSGQNT